MMRTFLSILLLNVFFINSFSQKKDMISLWPGKVPGELKPKAGPVSDTKTKDKVFRYAEVTDPALEVFMSDKSVSNGSAVIICPVGGYNILAYDLEGTEIAAWLNRLGYTAFVLQYRIPGKKEGVLQDAKLSVEVHILPQGAHGYGLRKGTRAGET